jgi:hypothetical protein
MCELVERETEKLAVLGSAQGLIKTEHIEYPTYGLGFPDKYPRFT